MSNHILNFSDVEDKIEELNHFLQKTARDGDLKSGTNSPAPLRSSSVRTRQVGWDKDNCKQSKPKPVK